MPSPRELSGSEITCLSFGKGYPLEVSAGTMVSLIIASDVFTKRLKKKLLFG